MRLNRQSHLTTLPRSRAQAALPLLFIGTITLSIGLNLLLQITGITSMQVSGNAGSQSQTVIADNGLMLSILLYGIITPLVEEFVFRMMLYSGIYSLMARRMEPSEDTIAVILSTRQLWYNCLISAVISSLLFGIYHMNLAQGIYAFVMGLAFCLAYELTGQFLSAWILHAACNIIALLLSQPVNGTNAFTQLCTVPWTAAFIAIAAVAFVCLSRIFHK